MTNKRIKFSLLLKKGNINSRAHSGGLPRESLSICNYPPPTLASTQNKNEGERAAHSSVADRLSTQTGATARRRFPLYRARFRDEQGRAFTLFPVEGALSTYSSANNHLKNTKSRLGQGDGGNISLLTSSISKKNPPPPKKKISLFCRLWYRNLVYIQIPPQFYPEKGNQQGNKYI
jgi:hypothetical protein